MNPITVQATKSPHAADGDILVVNCPNCSRRYGLPAPGPHACICSAQLDVKAYAGWGSPPTTKPVEPPSGPSN